jgi:hypothetical protein
MILSVMITLPAQLISQASAESTSFLHMYMVQLVSRYSMIEWISSRYKMYFPR